MSIAPDSVAHDFANGASGTVTFSHTCTGTNRLLVLFFVSTAPGHYTNVTSCSYNGVALTNATVVHQGSAPEVTSEIWYLVGPATGANTVSVTWANGSGVSPTGAIITASFTGVSQSSPLDNVNDAADTTTNPTCTLTTGINNALVVGGLRNGNGANAEITFTNLYSFSGGNNLASYYLAGTAGNVTDNYTCSGSGVTWALAMASFKPYIVSGINQQVALFGF
jgi:hypothetical protein